jgi:2-oxoglutarate dehydrogenase complex dehydrogenase (E1) component-like enzyme
MFLGSVGVASGAAPVVHSAARSDSLGISYLIRAYQVRGHEMASLDPLGLHAHRGSEDPPELDYKYHGFKDEDMDRQLNMVGNSTGGNTYHPYHIPIKPTPFIPKHLLNPLSIYKNVY